MSGYDYGQTATCKDHTIPIGLARSNPLGYSVEPLLQGASCKGSLAERVGFEPTFRMICL